MIPEWAEYTEKCYGDSDPSGNIDTFGRANKQIWGNFTAYNTAPALGTGEHDRDGAHMSDLDDNLFAVEADRYTGNGADNRNISFSDVGLDCKFIRILDQSDTYTFFKTEDMAGDTTKSTFGGAVVANYIQSIATTGQFQVGTALNVNSRYYYYIAYGAS